MRKDIHPQFNEIDVTCSCGNAFKTFSTLKDKLSVEICSSCHPFYTGQQKMIDTEGRVDGFMKKFGSFSKMAKKNKQDSE